MRFAHAFRAAFTAGALALIAGCGGIQVVDRTPSGGGTVALQGDEDRARDAATDYMARSCPFGYRILGEDEVYKRGSGTDPEIRIRYACKPAAQPSIATAGAP